MFIKLWCKKKKIVVKNVPYFKNKKTRHYEYRITSIVSPGVHDRVVVNTTTRTTRVVYGTQVNAWLSDQWAFLVCGRNAISLFEECVAIIGFPCLWSKRECATCRCVTLIRVAVAVHELTTRGARCTFCRPGRTLSYFLQRLTEKRRVFARKVQAPIALVICYLRPNFPNQNELSFYVPSYFSIFAQ